MSKMFIQLTLTVFGVSPTGENITLDLQSLASEWPVDQSALLNVAAELLSSAGFVLSGGTGHPTNPWGEEQEEPKIGLLYCPCGHPAIFIDGATRCTETGDVINKCRLSIQ